MNEANAQPILSEEVIHKAPANRLTTESSTASTENTYDTTSTAARIVHSI